MVFYPSEGAKRGLSLVLRVYIYESILLYVIRRRLDHISTESEIYRDIRGESSHYTYLEW